MNSDYDEKRIKDKYKKDKSKLLKYENKYLKLEIDLVKKLCWDEILYPGDLRAHCLNAVEHYLNPDMKPGLNYPQCYEAIRGNLRNGGIVTENYISDYSNSNSKKKSGNNNQPRTQACASRIC